MKLSGEYAVFKKGEQAGYDPKDNRYHDINGSRISKSAYLESKLTENSPDLRFIENGMFGSPMSKGFEKIENIVGSSGLLDTGKAFEEFAKKPTKAWPLPQDILTAMRLSEYFYRTEGDVAYALQVPREVLFAQEFKISSPLPEIEKDLKELYDEDQLDMIQLLKDIYDCEAVYGNVFPILLPSKDNKLAGVTLLNPKYVYCGSPIAQETMMSTAATTPESISTSEFTSTTYGLLSQTEKEWNKKVLLNEIHPLAYNAFGPRWNEQDVRGLWIDLNPKYLHPIQVNKQRWERYATPYLARAFRAITNRKVFEELRRATAEGYKSQLFMFNVGTPEVPGTVEELRIYAGILNSLAPERTGMILGRGNISGQVMHMDALQGLLAEETFHGLTINIFRNLGMNLRFVSGEHPNQRAGGTDDLDIMLFSERMTFKQKMMGRWERWFRLTLAEMTHPGDVKYMEAMRQTKVEFQKPMIEMASYIKSYLMPIFTIGAMSIKTFQEKAQLTPEVELANRKAEQSSGQDLLFTPRTTYVQTATNSDGDTNTSKQGDTSTDLRNSMKETPQNVVKSSLENAVEELRLSRELLTRILEKESNG